LLASPIIFFKALVGLQEKTMNDSKQSKQSSIYLMEEKKRGQDFQEGTDSDETDE